jgi:hypothetical protein
MSYTRVFRSFASRPTTASTLLVLAAVALLAPPACKHPTPGGDAPTPDPSAAPSAAPDPDDFKPLHPGHVNQRGPNGGFVGPRMAPPASHDPPPTPAANIDGPPDEIKLAEVKDEDGHCGEVDVGGEKVVLDCMTDDYSTVAGAAQSVVSSHELESLRSKRKLPAVVDHRKDDTEGPILDQGKSPTCTAFSLVTAANHAAARYLGHPANLSPMQAWARYHTPKMTLADKDNIGRGLADFSSFAYDARLAKEWQHGKRPDPHALHRADAESLVDITNITRLDAGSMSEIKSALAAGQDVWFAIKGAHGLVHPKKNADGESMISHFDSRSSRGGQQSGHAIVLAGYEDTPHGTFYLVHNSWGKKWGTDGYAWLWEKTLKANISDAYVLSVRPTELAHSHRVPHEHKYVTCRGDLAPDAATSQCVPTCADGGPRVNGVCPSAGDCPEGQVNLDGKCELSAPSLDKTLSDGVKVKCGLSGCTYVVPNGTATCGASQGCNVSCAAPRFMLGSGSRGLTCSG